MAPRFSSGPQKANSEFDMWASVATVLNTELGTKGYFPIKIHNNIVTNIQN